MRSILLPTGFDTGQITLYSLARDSGLAWDTVRDVLQGKGTIGSLDRLRKTLGLRWSWTAEKEATATGRALALRRKAKGLSQRAMADRLAVSPQTIVTLETRFRGRVETLRRYLRMIGLMDTLAMP